MVNARAARMIFRKCLIVVQVPVEASASCFTGGFFGLVLGGLADSSASASAASYAVRTGDWGSETGCRGDDSDAVASSARWSRLCGRLLALWRISEGLWLVRSADDGQCECR